MECDNEDYVFLFNHKSNQLKILNFRIAGLSIACKCRDTNVSSFNLVEALMRLGDIFQFGILKTTQAEFPGSESDTHCMCYL